ncbi:carbamoyltransferase family protein [Marinitenerispora sediminis]|uniref:Carbamoyltransferase n=1 Tax=Marinitenerispora sediminis TaxID=1931232 RepID=A0A368SZ76_9ACTN|nr:carbamoyltransferase C-terminal domain-containing protein [Marinitenerispora sediminis]RCV48832.1 carbamoyltransferase [Marinitenerispora sediminis]RCV49547.1 carbamoyltransferase [Marinitenerispora sediminis]RCV50563.1 carbamoyltransferase [Marinitenerispora sediminis]
MRFLGVNAVFHDPAAALVVDGEIVAAAEEERFSRRKHGKEPVPFSAWELPEQAMRWCLRFAGITPEELDGVAYSYDPSLVHPGQQGLDPSWERLRTLYAERAPRFLASALPGLDPARVRHIPHHVAHAASAGLAAPTRGGRADCAVFVADGRGEAASHLAGVYRDGELTVLARQSLPDSLGLMYEDLTQHLGFRRSSDEYKVMALASYGTPRFEPELRRLVHHTGDGRVRVGPIDWDSLVKRRRSGDECTADHADLAASVQRRLEDVLVELTRWLRWESGQPRLAMAGGVALNCVANTRIAAESGFDDVWVQPAAGDAGTALGGALHLAQQAGDRIIPMDGADLGRGWSDDELAAALDTAALPYEQPDDLAETVAAALARNELVAWFQGRSEYGPRALGRRSLLANPTDSANLERLNDVKGREQFRPVAPIVLAERAAEVFSRGPLPSPYMLFVHDVAPQWRERIPAVVHADGTARVQTVAVAGDPLLARLLYRFEAQTGVPVLVNTSLNTAGRPMVDDPRDALECFGSAPIDLLALGPFVVRRRDVHGRR